MKILDALVTHAADIAAVRRDIHAHPELNYQEVFAHDLLTNILDDLGHAPVRHAYGVDTAFEASVGAAGPEIAVLCEYDALPGIGHACGQGRLWPDDHEINRVFLAKRHHRRAVQNVQIGTFSQHRDPRIARCHDQPIGLWVLLDGPS